MSTLFTVSAPSGAGKTSLVKALVAENPNIVLSVSHTTRKRREGEVDGQDYYFTDDQTFIDKVGAGAFLEHAKVFDHYYGTSQKAVEEQLAEGKGVILEIDWQGAMQVKKAKPETVAIFILPPSRQALESRLTGRGQDSEEVIAKRLAQAAEEISHYVEADFLIVNDDFELALEQLKMVVLSQDLSLNVQKDRCRELLSELLNG